MAQMPVEPPARIVTSDRGVAVDVAMALGEFHPQRPASLQVPRPVCAYHDVHVHLLQ
jgi:hypothetical protein